MKKKRKTELNQGSQLLLNIRYHQHHSWQGSVQRLDTGETINFRSALELMALIEETIGSQSHEEREPFRTWGSVKQSKEVKSAQNCANVTRQSEREERRQSQNRTNNG